MSTFFKRSAKSPSRIMLPKTSREHRNIRGAGLAMCKVCHAFYYKKAWHHNTDMLSPEEARSLRVAFVLCPADAMIKDGLYEGELTIERIPDEARMELLNLIRGFGRRAYERDTQHRVIGIAERRGAFVITTTENQLAQKLARKIKDVFNKVELATSFSKEPDKMERVRVRFV